MKRQKVEHRSGTRLSDLPEHIAHHILGFLPTKQATRTSSLSTTWLSIWRRYPIHDYNEARFLYLYDSCRPEFLRSISAAVRGNGDALTVQKLRVSTINPIDGELTELINQLIGVGVSKSKLLTLNIAIESCFWLELANGYPSVYEIPVAVLSSAKWLTSLTLQACSLNAWVDFSLPSLAKISLKHSFIDPKTLQSLISGSPSLEYLGIDRCFNIDVIRVFNPRLKRLAITRHEELTLLEIDAPSLGSFEYSGSRPLLHNWAIEIADQCTEILEFKSLKGSEGFRCLKTVSLSYVRMKESVSNAMVSAFSNLETASLEYCSLGSVSFKSNRRLSNLIFQTTEFESLALETSNIQGIVILNYSILTMPIFKDILSNQYRHIRSLTLGGNLELPNRTLGNSLVGPFLVSLVIRSCLGLSRIDLSSASLKKIVIELCADLNEVSITTPNLASFKFIGRMIKLSTVAVPTQVKVDLHFQETTKDGLKDGVYAHKLWSFLKKFEFIKALKVGSNDCEILTLPKRSRYFPPFLYLEDYKVTTILWSVSYLYYLQNVLTTSFFFGTVKVNTGSGTSNITLKFEGPSNMATLVKQNLYRKQNSVVDHLKEVTIEDFQCDNNQMEVVAWLVKTAAKLNRMNVSFEKNSPASDRDKFISLIMRLTKANPSLQFNFAV